MVPAYPPVCGIKREDIKKQKVWDKSPFPLKLEILEIF